MGNNQSKKLAAKQFNEARQWGIDNAPRLAREREEYYKTPAGKKVRKQQRMSATLIHALAAATVPL